MTFNQAQAFDSSCSTTADGKHLATLDECSYFQLLFAKEEGVRGEEDSEEAERMKKHESAAGHLYPPHCYPHLNSGLLHIPQHIYFQCQKVKHRIKTN